MFFPNKTNISTVKSTHNNTEAQCIIFNKLGDPPFLGRMVACMYAHVRVCVLVCVHICLYVCFYVCSGVCMCACELVSVLAGLCVLVLVHMCVYGFAYAVCVG